MTLLAQLDARLNTLHATTAETPLFNPVFQLSLELSRRIESGDLPLSEVAGLVAELECEGLLARAERLEKLVAPLDPEANLAALRSADGDNFASFAARWKNPLLHVVFTAHPTFLLTQRQSAAVAAAATQGTIEAGTACVAPHERDAITLGSEHAAVLAALANAQGARDTMVSALYAEARRRWPDQWRSLNPLPLRFASWVGYDMDGRTDISWVTSLSYRLTEKAERLRSYANLLAGPAADLAGHLRAAADYAAIQADRLADTDPGDPAALSLTANSFNADHPFKLTSLAPILTELERLIAAAEDDTALQLLTVAAAMRADGLGMGWIHFRVNASQLQNAIRRRIDPTGKLDLASQAALVRMRELLAEAKPLRSNMAALGIESSTAVRQFLAMVQILGHIDADAPIRMLVAECEQPTTMLAALYFAKLFGIESKVDVSPLFETESALEHGGRFLDALLAEPAYRDYARARGRVAIQAGFSDAGRFVGQVPAALAIERLQGRLAEAMAANGLDDVAALVFNTHGEGMGRGAHPSSFADRAEWPLSPWARRRFVRAGIRLEPEVSFQGGDGYLFFGTPELALATLSRFAAVRPAEADPDAPTDPFYRRTDLSLDFYRAIRRFQAEQLVSRTYARAVTAFGLGMLNDTGSRKSRRQSDLAADREMSLRQIRAIPHNAVLQQLGYPVNVIGGFGTAAEGNYEALADLLSTSARGRQMVRLVRASNALASIKTVAAYGELFNSAYWASRPYRGGEEAISDACLSLAEHLTTDDRTGVFRRLASRLRVDALKLHRLLDLVPDEAPLENREHTRRLMGVLQALRLALYQHMFLRAVSVPQFSRANDIAREDVLEMVFTLRIDEALAQLRRAFPVIVPNLGDFTVTAPSDYPDEAAVGYEAIHRDCIEPIAQAQALALRISTSVANLFGAHG